MFKAAFSAVCVLALSLQVSAHAIIMPDISLAAGTVPARSDVTRPSTSAPCGNGVSIAADVAKAPVVPVVNGQFTVNVTNFNAGADGSTAVSATVDPTAAGTSFPVTADIITNGNPTPTKVETDAVTVGLPAGTACTGGADQSSCLVAFKTTAGFGNCVLVSTKGDTGAAAAAAPAAANSTAAAASTNGAAAAAASTDGTAAAAAGNSTTAAAPAKGKGKGKGHNNASSKNCTHQDKRAIGSRAARPMRAVVEARRIQEGSLI